MLQDDLLPTQGSRGRRIQRPGTIKLDSGRIKMPRAKSQDANFFSRGTTENCDQNSYCLLALKFNPPLVDPVIACVLKQQLRIIQINHELQLIM